MSCTSGWYGTTCERASSTPLVVGGGPPDASTQNKGSRQKAPVFKVFDRYTKVTTPNGRAIHIVIAPGYPDRMAVYGRKVLVNHLTAVEGSKYGEKRAKRLVANAISTNNGVLTFYPTTEMHQQHRPNLRAAGVLAHIYALDQEYRLVWTTRYKASNKTPNAAGICTISNQRTSSMPYPNT